MRAALARGVVRVYPRAWRARYEEEMLALVDSSPVTVGVVIDLAAGAGREWVHAAIGRLDAPPLSANQEFKRDLVVTVGAAGVLWLGSWVMGAGLARLGVESPVPPLLATVVFTAQIGRGCVFYFRRARRAHRASIAGVCLLSFQAPGLAMRTRERWLWAIGLMIAATLDQTRLSFLLAPQFVWSQWYLHQQSSDKLARMDALVQLRRAAMKAGSALP